MLQYSMLKSMVQQLAYRGWHRVNRQAKRVADWSGGGGMVELRIVSDRRQRTNCSFTHA